MLPQYVHALRHLLTLYSTSVVNTCTFLKLLSVSRRENRPYLTFLIKVSLFQFYLKFTPL
nr:MAG TPA: hypothetical protein [Caudoviricetes sp.]DAK59237.1 MAG TPA: hypothetical protein [Caudoviricetes sp.]